MRAAAHRLSIIVSVVAGLAGAIAAPAWAQPLSVHQQGVADLRDAQLRAQLDMANRQAVLQQNQLSALDTQIRTQQAFSNLQAQAYAPIVPPVSVGAVIDPGQFVSMPDDRLAASNARVRALTENHH
jgi:hypothetical protein